MSDIQPASLSKAEERRLKYKAYYEAHKDHINSYRKQSGLAKRSYDKYYESRKEMIKRKNLERYYRKKEETLRLAIPLEQSPDVEEVQELENSPA